MDNNKKENGNLDLRIIIIGDERVGKKTLTKRIQMLNSTETKQIKNNLLLYHESKEEKRKKKLKKFIHINKTSEDKIKDKGQLENYDYRDKETLLFVEKEIKKEKERKKLMSIQKIYKFFNYNPIKISVYPCIEIQPFLGIASDEEKIDDFEKKYNKSIKGLIDEISQIISLQNNNSIDNQIEILFLFCFDLSNFNTFKSIYLYYNELNKIFNTQNNYKMALIGNKNDIKKLLKEKQKQYFNNFILETNINYYEISSLLYFNFESFFEKLFFDFFENKYNYNNKEFKEKFHHIISQKQNFSKSQKTLISKDIYPSPNKYYNNPFEYPLSKKTLIILFKSKNKYNKKIFLNKNGPIYPILFNKKEDDDLKKITNKNIVNTARETKTESIFINTEIIQNAKKYLKPYSHRPGYSIGGFHSDHSLSLMKNRRKLNEEKIREMNEALENKIDIGLRNKKKLKKIRSYDKSNIILLKQEILKNKLENEKILKERHYNMNLQNKSLEDEKINKILEKEKKYDKKYIQRKKKLLKEKMNSFKKTLKTSKSLKSKRINVIPKAKFYDTVSSISLKKGFSFGKKIENKKFNFYTPDYPYILDDFEKIVNKYKNKKEIKSYSDRFPKYKTDEVGASREMMEKKQKVFERNRKKLKSKAFSDFFDYMKRHKNAFKLRKEKIKEKEEEQYKDLVNNKYFLTEIQYSQVETSYPKYSISGKFNINKIKDYENENTNILEEELFRNIWEEKPDISKVRPHYPTYSFGKEERFKKTASDFEKYKNKNKKLNFKDEESNNWLFKNGIFGYNDKQSYLKTQTFMGLGKRSIAYKDNGFPGPGQYSIKGFADLITRNKYKNVVSKTERNSVEN